ncbi:MULTISPECIES: hypothetical protein [unclassified Streptomyces]|uniref:hypothetical protein n=1 Tax=unclassified Streptomyces TaxID=2593676 RepID=UPI00336A75AC
MITTLEFRQIAIIADDIRSGWLTTHDVNVRDLNFTRYREECLGEGRSRAGGRG